MRRLPVVSEQPRKTAPDRAIHVLLVVPPSSPMAEVELALKQANSVPCTLVIPLSCRRATLPASDLFDCCHSKNGSISPMEPILL